MCVLIMQMIKSYVHAPPSGQVAFSEFTRALSLKNSVLVQKNLTKKSQELR